MKLAWLLLAAGCLFSAAFAVQPGFDGGEFLLDTAGIHASSPFDENVPAVVFGGSGYLLVWEDERSGNFDIYGCRVTAQGEVLDPAGIGIATAGHHQRQPAVAFDGTNFLVVWTDFGAGPGNANICGARVTPDGAVLEPAGFVISGATGNQASASAAFSGVNFLVVWEDARRRLGYLRVPGDPARYGTRSFGNQRLGGRRHTEEPLGVIRGRRVPCSLGGYAQRQLRHLWLPPDTGRRGP